MNQRVNSLAEPTPNIAPIIDRSSKAHLIKKGVFALLWLCLTSSVYATSLFDLPSLFGNKKTELLTPEQAYSAEFQQQTDGTGELFFTVAEGYYLYQDKFKFTLDDVPIMVQSPLPKATMKDDLTFGQVAVYDQPVILKLSALDLQKGGTLIARFQGCADQGVCYPPQKASFEVKPKQLKQLTPLTSSQDILPANEAFKVSFMRNPDGSARVLFDVVPGHYLYKDQFRAKLDLQAIPVSLPQGTMKDDPLFGKVTVYTQPMSLLLKAKDLASGGLLNVRYQGCADIGICYPPQSFKMQLEPQQGSSIGAQTPQPTNVQSANKVAGQIESEQSLIIETLQSGQFWGILLLFFVSGLLLAFTPCVLPMIPILSSIIIGQNPDQNSAQKTNTKNAFIISLVYVLAMAFTYTIAGILAGVFGENLQAALQNVWVIASMSGILLLLALSMFGFYDLQVPAFIQTRLTLLSNKQKNTSLLGVATMGFISALVVGPCMTPPLTGALIYIGQTGDAVLGGFSLFALSMGMGLPLIIFGTTAGKFMPKTGAWMNVVKLGFGVMLIGLAIWLLDRIVPVWVSMILWGVLFIVCAIYMGAFEPLAKRGWSALWKGLAWVLLIMGAILLLGVASGGRSLLQPLENLVATTNTATAKQQNVEAFVTIKSGTAIEDVITSARAQQQPLVMYVTAKWCVSCKELAALTFSEPEVAQKLNQLGAIKIDVTDNTADDKAFMKKYGIIGPPAIIFIGKSGQELENLKTVGFVSASDLLDRLHELSL